MTRINQEDALAIFDRLDVILKGHFRYTSGFHGDRYVNKDALYPHPAETAELCNEIATRFTGHLNRKDKIVVVGPAMGGIILSHVVAQCLAKRYFEAYGIYVEKDGHDNFIIKRGFDKFLKGAFIFITEDILTTGGSAKKVVDLIKSLGYGDKIIAVGALWNRGNIKAKDIGVREFFALVNLSFPTWKLTECPLCAQGIPFNQDVGKGKETQK